MCGIFGIIKNDCDIDIQKNLKTIKHRGPDDEGIYQNYYQSIKPEEIFSSN